MDPMDIDPIDGGPKTASNIPPLSASPSHESSSTSGASLNPPLLGSPNNNNVMTKEEDAKQVIEQLRGEDLAGRIAASNRLEGVAAVLGPQRTREELLPFLTDGIDDEDEVLLGMAASLGKMVPLVGGADQAHVLLQPLELLLDVEETTVRDAAAESAQTISSNLPDSTFQQHYAAMLLRLAEKEWFTARISAAGLMAQAYPRLSPGPQQEEHISVFAKLCQDDTPMVRRVAAKNLGTMVENVVGAVGRKSLDADGGAVSNILVPLYESFASGDQPDSVRLHTTENCAMFGRVMGELAKSSDGPLNDHEMTLVRRLLPLVVATIDDRSWRVRWTAASKFADIIKAYSPIAGTMDMLVPAYEKLLQDPEAEVRTAATFNLARVAQGCETKIPPATASGSNGEDELMTDAINNANSNVPESERVTAAERLVKRVTSLTEDDSEHVRAALAMVATELAPILGKDATITHLVPPILLLLRDAASEVRLNLISSLESLNEVIGVDLLSQSLLPAILDLAQDGKWRIRLAIIEQIPLLAKQLGRDFFTDKLVAICVNWLGDDIATIRDAATSNLKHLTSIFGTDWACEYLLPAIEDVRRHTSYLRRMTAVQACARMALEMDAQVAQVEMLPLLLEMSTDPVPNIRFNVAKSLAELGPVIWKGPFASTVYDQQVHPVLTLLQEDSDRDVRFYANSAATTLDEARLTSTNEKA
eukprot:CAMPEP_0113491478 /NCGR_PEP_ID=MMETSP0014_2-20120614/27576_1 /TAXON_ID=2857 /ORGANISM="Nitzschia sp." /LENGTH=704 /DNA_ID=CAMNT_0000385269 /DNA_START=209 /DNA_END=2323 /DNA_ORIENTATION=- /assembly_acc=CAM_ASM_000159